MAENNGNGNANGDSGDTALRADLSRAINARKQAKESLRAVEAENDRIRAELNAAKAALADGNRVSVKTDAFKEAMLSSDAAALGAMNPQQVARLLGPKVEIDYSGGDCRLVAIDDAGERTGQSLRDFMVNFLSEERNANLVRPDAAGTLEAIRAENEEVQCGLRRPPQSMAALMTYSKGARARIVSGLSNGQRALLADPGKRPKGDFL